MLAYLLEYNRYLNFFGIGFIFLIAYLASANRKKIQARTVFSGIVLQFLLGAFALKTVFGQALLIWLASVVEALYRFADSGIQFLFGALGVNTAPWGVVFAFQVLPIIVFFGAFTSILFHFGIIQVCVSVINYLLRPILGTSGAETLCAVANSFLGQTEAPLLVRNYLRGMTKSEMFVVMVSGMASISGSILVVFSKIGVPTVHMLVASIMSIPASIVMAKMLIPETEKTKTGEGSEVTFERTTNNVFDAIFVGTTDGLQLAINVGAMLIVFISLITMVNALLFWGSDVINMVLNSMGILIQIPMLSLKYIFSFIFSPVAFFLGLTGQDALQVADLLGTKVSINEMVAYLEMIPMDLPPRVQAITTYALCGFSNFSCIGIQIGGIGALVPEKRKWLTELGLKAVFASAMANILSAFVASILI